MNKGYFLVFITAVISGFSIFINKYGVAVVDPYIFTFLKVSAVAVLLTGLLLAMKDWRTLKGLSKKQWFLLVLVGLVGGSIPFLLFFKGLSLTTAAQGSFIHKTMFIYAAILAALFLKEKIGKKFLFGGSLLFLGSMFLLAEIPHSLNPGDFLVFSAALFWAIENVLSKYVLRNLEGRTVAWARMFFGALFILFFLAATGQFPLAVGLTAEQIGWTALTAIILFAYVLTWYAGLKLVPVSHAAAILLLGSPITTFLSLISGGIVSAYEIFGGILIILGICFAFGLREIWKALGKIKNLVYVRV